MAHSKLVLKDGYNKHASRLVKAAQSIENLEDYELMPQGVWGSTATIKSGGVTIKSSELDIEFEVPFDDDLESNEGEIIVYNLSDNTIRNLKAKAEITIEAGYTGDTGVIFSGYINKAFTKNEGADRVTTIKVIDDIKKKESLNRSYESGRRASYILRTLLNLTGLPIAKFSPVRDYTYENSLTVDESIESAIKRFSEVCGVSTFVNKGKIYSCQLRAVDDSSTFTVSSETGMIGSPMPFTEEITAESYKDTVVGYEIDMLLQHRMTTGSKIKLSSNQYNGTFYVKSGVHRFNESECTTSIKVVGW